MTWKPLPREDLDQLISAGLALYDDRVCAEWERIRIEPAKWQCSPWGDQGGGFWAVAIQDGVVHWYNDIEDGFNTSRFTEIGTIGEYWCSETQFAGVLERFAQAHSADAWRSLEASVVPAELRGPGTITRRQTTYWDLLTQTGVRLRVHFKDKVESRFARKSFQEVLVANEHPLLGDYDDPWMSVFIAGKVANPDRLVGQLDELIRQRTDDWRDVGSYSSREQATARLGEGHGLLMRAPESTANAIAPLLKEFNVRASLLDGRPSRSGYRALVLGESYVVAGDFAFERPSPKTA